MKIFGYVRDKDGNFENRKNKVIEFSKQMNFAIDKFICEKSSENYEDMVEIRKLLENEKDFVLLVSDASDLFEDDYACKLLSLQMDRKNVFLLDAYYPKFNCKKLLTGIYKIEPVEFLENAMIMTVESHLRLYNDKSVSDKLKNEIKGRVSHWKNGTNPLKRKNEKLPEDEFFEKLI